MSALSGCASSTGDPRSTIWNDAAPRSRRVAAVHALHHPDAATLWRDLSGLAADRTVPTPVRLAAVDRLHTIDPARVAAQAVASIESLHSPAFRAGLLQRVAADHWPGADRILARAWAVADTGVEHGHLARLTGIDPLDHLADRFAGDAPGWTPADRLAAWTVLAHHRDHAQLAALAASVDLVTATPDPVRDPLRAAALVLDRLPVNATQLAQWNHLTPREHGELAAARRRWPGLAARHLATARGRPDPATDDALAHPPRVVDPVARTTFGVRRATESRPDTPYRDLPAADRATLHALADALRAPGVAAALFDSADADHADPTTEHGGLLFITPAGPAYRAYPTDLPLSDQRYAAPPALLEDLPRALAHVHFHAQAHDHADYAGPAGGDLDFVDRFGCHGLVLTFTDPNTLNADWYAPTHQGTQPRFDLGSITRP